MAVNAIYPSRGLHTIREMVETFSGGGSPHEALSMRKGDGYWTLSYGELSEYVRNLAAALRALGVGKGDKVGVISENRSEWVITYLAVTSSGAVIVPYDILLKTEELSSIIRASGVKIILTSSEYLEKVTKAGGPDKRVVLFDPGPQAGAEAPFRPDGSPSPARLVSFFPLVEAGAALRSRGADPFQDPLSSEDMAALIFTSGTTGTPKGVMLTHRNLVENGDGTQQTTQLGPGDNWIIVLPFHHTYPTMMGIIVPLLTFGRITCVPSMKTNVLIQIMKDTGATCIPAMPLLVEKLYKGILAKVKEKPAVVQALFKAMFAVSKFFFTVLHVRIGKALFKSVSGELGLQKLRFFVSGGGPIAKEIIDGMESLGLTTFNGYGLTETSPVISSCCPVFNKPGSVGIPLPNVEVRIDGADENGNGEILCRGSNVMKGYMGMPEKTREMVDADGWLHTGDIGKLDSDGYLFITGRLKNIIVTKGGKNIYPEEIENMLLTSPLLSEVVVLGKLDKDGGEYPYAVIYVDPDAKKALETETGHAIGPEEMKAAVKAEIHKCTAQAAVYKIPQGFEISQEELPKTSTRKVKRYMFASAK